MERITGYAIEPAMIPLTPTYSEQVWFLDAVIQNPDGSRSTSNICNGSREYCQDTLNKIRSAKP